MSAGGESPESGRSVGDLVEVAVALPLAGTFTYRDPRGGGNLVLGSQVVVPFGTRRVTGFVVGFPTSAPKSVKDIDEVAEGEPPVDPAVLDLCRWAAAYYMAPLGLALRAAVPQTERTTAVRRVVATAAAQRLLEREDLGQRTLRALALDEADRGLLRRLVRSSKGLTLAGLQRGRLAGRLHKLIEDGWVQAGDSIEPRSSERKRLVAVITSTAGGTISPRATAKRALLDRIKASPSGIVVSQFSAAEKSVLRGLVRERLVALAEVLDEAALDAGGAMEPQHVLNAAQTLAVQTLSAKLGAGYATFLLQGITGSGKTEVYLRVVADARRRGKGALVLVPEIALTPQLAGRFRARFGDDVAVLHSGLPATERRAAWRRLRAGKVGIALGARSAVFAPVVDLGVVVVDEEHDSSFKQDMGLRYNARDLAVVRAQKAGALAILGTATPSLETFHNVTLGRFSRLLLSARANPTAALRPLPPVEIVDLRRFQTGPDGLFSAPLAQAIDANLAAGEQTILFLNRRGFAPLVLCRACGYVVRCTQCEVAMTYHHAAATLLCHYCAYAEKQPGRCPRCRSTKIERLGVGTEQLESAVRTRFPAARVARLDRDTAGTSASAVQRVLDRVRDREVDVLVGTQMVTKGHDFPGVTLVGIVMPDQGMHLPDFRASERTFALLEQVAGRAGRAELAGKVVVQTFNPDHPAVRALISHDYEGFARAELQLRHEAGYPPWHRMIAIRLDATDEAAVRSAAADVARRAGQGPGVRVLGPAEAPIRMIRGRLRYQVWLVGADRAQLAAAARRGAQARLPPGVRLAIDVDPLSVL